MRGRTFTLGILCVFVSVCVGVSVWAPSDAANTPPHSLYGEVKSPLYPQPYPPGVYEEWEISVAPGYRIQLTFTHLDVEPSDDCYYDSLMIIHDDKILWKFCGTANSADGNHPGNLPIMTPSNKLRLIFQADETNPGLHKHIGFSLFYQAVDVDECAQGVEPGGTPPCSQICLNTLGSYICSCSHGYDLRGDQRTCTPSCQGGEFRELQGSFSSPGFPEASPHGLHCLYNITVETGFHITLNFSQHFHIEHINTPQEQCLYHWLQVIVPGREPWKLCGAASPGLVPTGANWVLLEYHTDWDGLSRGWDLLYTTQRVKCAVPGGVTHGRVTPSLPQYLYKDYIHVRCDKGYKMMKDGKEIKTFGAMCQSNGEWHIPLPECHIIDCGDPQAVLNGKYEFISDVKDNQYLSTIQYSCHEPYYAFDKNYTAVQFKCQADRKWEQITNDVIPVCVPVCGRPVRSYTRSQRVLAGKVAKAGEFPWQVLLNAGGRAGAFVIAPQWLLTAAHNLEKVTSEQEIEVYVGGVDVAEMIHSKVPFNVSSTHVHPNYYNQDSKKNFDNDIALLKLAQPITFNEYVMPLCLPTTDSKYPTDALGVVSGFGITEKWTIANELRYIELPLVDQGRCAASMDRKRISTSNISPLTDNMFCAGFPEGVKDTCGGDSGGAFALNDGDRYWAAGIVSWGIGCGKRDTYGVYTRVAQYLDWINRTMEDNAS